MKIKGREDGQVLVFLALSMVVLLAIAGLAIDGGIAYGVKAKLSSAMDAAAWQAPTRLATAPVAMQPQ